MTPTDEQVERSAARFDHALQVALVAEALLKGFWFSDEKQAVRAARAAIAALQPQDGWQDIASAPRDGTRVLLWMEPTPDPRYVSNDPAQPVMASYVIWSDAMKREGMRDGWSWYGPVRCHPTHWRPLPAPPAAEIERKKD